MAYGDDAIAAEDGKLSYASYLKVPELLSLQQLQSRPEQHDELLFILIHQVYELWFKQIIHEVTAMMRNLDDDRGLAFLKGGRRVGRILDVLIKQIDVLETMTPNDFDHFRSLLNPASGFQSHQFRVAEYALGLKVANYQRYHKSDPVALAALDAAFANPSLYDYVLAYFARRGVAIPEHVLERDVTQPYALNDDIAKAFAAVYRNSEEQYGLYTMLELLMDLDQKLLLWRFRHVSMVERIIGITRGTGGTHGVEYLSSTLKKRCFPEVWEARQHIISMLPAAPGGDV